MSWDDIQTSSDSITFTEWNDMVTYTKDVSPSSGTIDASTFMINSVEVTASAAELNYLDGVTSNVQTQLDGKAPSLTSDQNYVSDAQLVNISNLDSAAYEPTSAFASALGADDNYVTDAEKVVIGNTSGVNSGDVTVTDSSEIDFTLTGQDITASIKSSSIDETKLDTSVNASLDLADSAMQDLVDDTTPELGGELDAGAHTIGFTLTDNGNSSTADTIDWKLSNKQKSTLTGNCTFTFTAPSNPCSIQLLLVQDATGSRTVTWPATVKWPSGTAPTLTTTANGVDIISFLYDGTSYYGAASLDFS